MALNAEDLKRAIRDLLIGDPEADPPLVGALPTEFDGAFPPEPPPEPDWTPEQQQKLDQQRNDKQRLFAALASAIAQSVAQAVVEHLTTAAVVNIPPIDVTAGGTSIGTTDTATGSIT